MKKLFIGIMMICLVIGFSDTSVAETTLDKVVCKTDSFTEVTRCIYTTKDIKGFNTSFIGKSPNDNEVTLLMGHYPKTWDLLRQSRIMLFKIDGILHRKTYKLSTKIGNGYVIEWVQIVLDKEFVSLIANSKKCKIRIGCCKETFINQKYKDGMKELLLK